MGVIKGDLNVNFTGGGFNVGEGEWGMMSYFDKHRWVFPIFTNAHSFANSNGYIRKRGDRTLQFLMVKEATANKKEDRKVIKSTQNRPKGIQKCNKTSDDLKGIFANLLLIAVNALPSHSDLDNG